MWTRVENGDPMKPLEYEESGNNVIVRRAYHKIAAGTEMPEHWSYEEWQMTREQYAVFDPLNSTIEEQSDALVELAELAAEQDDALAELAELIENQQKGAEKWQKSTITASKQVL